MWDAVGAEWARSRPYRTWRAHSDAVNRRLIERWLPVGGAGTALKTDAFDEAFGTGVTESLAARSDEVWVVDLSPTTMRVAQDRNPRLRAAVCDVRRLPFRDAAFQSVVSLSTLDHFERQAEIEAALDEIGRVLAPGGRLVVTLDNARNPVVGLRNRLPYGWLHRIGLVPYQVGFTLSADGLEQALTRVGFEVHAREAVLHCPRAPAVFLAGLVDRWSGERARRAFLRAAGAFERLSRWPGRYRTGYFVAVLGVKPGAARGPAGAGESTPPGDASIVP